MPSTPYQSIVSQAASQNAYVNALLWEGWRWGDGSTPGTNITYFFGSAGENLSGIFGSEVTTSLAWQPHERIAYQNALQLWANVANITFTPVTSYNQADLVEFVFSNSAAALGIHETPEGAYYSDGTAWGVYNRGGQGFTQSGLQLGGYGFATLVHEIGHALGLSHPHDGGGDGIGLFPGVTPDDPWNDLGDNDLNQAMFSIMSYADGWRTGLGGVSPSNNYGWQSGPMAFDIAAIQALYGANTTFHSGSDIYTLGASNAFLSCIWDTGGTDTIVYNGIYDCTIDLRAATLANEVGGGGYVSYVDGAPAGQLDHWSAFTIANGVVIENANGGSGDDSFFLSSLGVNNHIDGGEGIDTVYVPYAYSDNSWYSFGEPGWIIPVASTASGLEITWWAGTDILDNIEFVHFADGVTIETFLLALDYHHYTAPTTFVSISDVEITEGNSGTKLATFTVTRAGGTQAFDVDFATADGSAMVANGDYVAKSGTLHFAANVTTQTISIEIKGDRNLELKEAFSVNLLAATDGVVIGDSAATATILNDDTVLLPEIEVTGNGIFIADGDATPGLGDLTNFGLATAGDRVVHTFTVTNNGGRELTTSNLKLPKGFVLIEGLSPSIAPGASDTFQVMLDTSTLGTKAGQISFTTNDIDEKAFNFSVTGVVNPVHMNGSDRDNIFRATEHAEAIAGEGGNDTVSYAVAKAGVTASLLKASANTGFAASDTYNSIENLTGSAFSDALTGDAFGNVLEGGLSADKLDGGLGIDTASYANAASGVTAHLSKSANNLGEALGDTYKSIENLLGSDHNDTLVANTLANVLNGGAGEDNLTGLGGSDTLIGGLAADAFHFVAVKDGGTTGDMITDFVSGEDSIGISRNGFRIAPGVDLGAVDALDFAEHYFVSQSGGIVSATNPSGVAPDEAGHGQFLFNEDTDQLWWDADGTGTAKAVLLATFQNGAHVHASDFDLM